MRVKGSKNGNKEGNDSRKVGCNELFCFPTVKWGKLPSPEYAENGTGQTDKMDGRYFDSNIRDFFFPRRQTDTSERSRMSSGLSFFPATYRRFPEPTRRIAVPAGDNVVIVNLLNNDRMKSYCLNGGIAHFGSEE